MSSSTGAGTILRGNWTAPGSRRSTGSATGCSRPTRSLPGSTRASACSTTARRGCSAARRSRTRWASFVRATIRGGCGCSRPTAPAACGGCSQASTRPCAPRAGPWSCVSARARVWGSAWRRCVRRRSASSRRRDSPISAHRRCGCSSCSSATGRRKTCSTSPSSRPAAARGSGSRAMRPPEKQSSRRRSTSWPSATATCSRSCSKASRAPTRAPRSASPASTSRTCSSTLATCCANTRRSSSARPGASAPSWSTSSRTPTAFNATSST